MKQKEHTKTTKNVHEGYPFWTVLEKFDCKIKKLWYNVYVNFYSLQLLHLFAINYINHISKILSKNIKQEERLWNSRVNLIGERQKVWQFF